MSWLNPNREHVAVEPERVAYGPEKGDIVASYSADKLMLGKGVREPFSFRGALWVAIGIGSGGGQATVAECYRVVPPRAFKGAFRDRGKRDEDHRHQFGSYHGDKTKHRGADVMLAGAAGDLHHQRGHRAP